MNISTPTVTVDSGSSAFPHTVHEWSTSALYLDVMSLSRLYFGALLLLYVSLPIFAFAQTQGRGLPKQIVPCAGAMSETVNGVTTPACTCKSLIDLAQNIIDGGIYIAVFLSAALFVYAGWLYMTKETIQGQKDAKNVFKNVLIGLVIILTAWLVVDTIMRSVGGSEFGGSWSDMCKFFGDDSGDWSKNPPSGAQIPGFF